MLKTSILVLAAMILLACLKSATATSTRRGMASCDGERDTKCPPSSCPWKKKEETKIAGEFATVVACIAV